MFCYKVVKGMVNLTVLGLTLLVFTRAEGARKIFGLTLLLLAAKRPKGKVNLTNLTTLRIFKKYLDHVFRGRPYSLRGKLHPFNSRYTPSPPKNRDKDYPKWGFEKINKCTPPKMKILRNFLELTPPKMAKIAYFEQLICVLDTP